MHTHTVHTHTHTHTNTYTPALYHPNDIFCDAGLLAIHIANRLMRKAAKSDNMCAASVRMARLLDSRPPVGNVQFNHLTCAFQNLHLVLNGINTRTTMHHAWAECVHANTKVLLNSIILYGPNVPSTQYRVLQL